MFLRTWQKGGRTYASVVRSVREGNSVTQKTVCYLGAVAPEQVPYLKAAYSKRKPKLVYADGRVYDPGS